MFEERRFKEARCASCSLTGPAAGGARPCRNFACWATPTPPSSVASCTLLHPSRRQSGCAASQPIELASRPTLPFLPMLPRATQVTDVTRCVLLKPGPRCDGKK